MNFADIDLHASDTYSIPFTWVVENIVSRNGQKVMRHGRQDDR